MEMEVNAKNRFMITMTQGFPKYNNMNKKWLNCESQIL